MRNVLDKIVEKIKTHFGVNNIFPPKIVPFMGQCGKIRKAVEATDDNITYRMRNFCWVTKATEMFQTKL